MKSWWASAAFFLVAAIPAGADDRAEQDLLRRWKDALQRAPRLTFEYRVRSINQVFEFEEVGQGTYYRDGFDRWAHRVVAPAAGPVSALEPANLHSRRERPIIPYGVISTPNAFWIGSGDPPIYDVQRFPPVSADEAENASPTTLQQAWSFWVRKAFDVDLALIYRMPLFLAETSIPGDCNVAAHKRPNGDIYLQLTPARLAGERAFFKHCGAVFRAHEDLPYAVRIVDFTGAIETRYLIHNVRRGDDAQFTHDAFEPTANIRPADAINH